MDRSDLVGMMKPTPRTPVLPDARRGSDGRGCSSILPGRAGALGPRMRGSELTDRCPGSMIRSSQTYRSFICRWICISQREQVNAFASRPSLNVVDKRASHLPTMQRLFS